MENPPFNQRAVPGRSAKDGDKFRELAHSLIDFTQHGAYTSLFILEAVGRYANEVVSTDPEALREMLRLTGIDPELWGGIAQELDMKVARLMGARSPRPVTEIAVCRSTDGTCAVVSNDPSIRFSTFDSKGTCWNAVEDAMEALQAKGVQGLFAVDPDKHNEEGSRHEPPPANNG